jgi:hypothetical protein
MPYGFDDEQWDDMFAVALSYLERLASNQGDCDYTTFCREVRTATGHDMDPHGIACSHLLERVGDETFQTHEVVVTALVHYMGDGIEPGPGFFTLCHRLGIIEELPANDDQRLQIVSDQVRRVQAAYDGRRR